MSDMKKRPDSGKIELEAWGFCDPLGLVAGFSQALSESLERTPPRILLARPNYPDYKPLSDPLVIDLFLELGASEFEGPSWNINLDEIFDYAFDMHEYGPKDDRKVEDGNGLNPRQIVASLRLLADRLEARIEPAKDER